MYWLAACSINGGNPTDGSTFSVWHLSPDGGWITTVVSNGRNMQGSYSTLANASRLPQASEMRLKTHLLSINSNRGDCGIELANR